MAPMRRVFGCAVLLMTTVFAGNVRHVLLIDRSGSMRPYYQNGLAQELIALFASVSNTEGNTEIYAFGTTTTQVQNAAQIEALPFSGSTYLDRAIDRASATHAAIAWMVTDNVEEQPGATEASNTEVFFRKLRSDAVRRLTVFPLRQSPGHAGIVVYALLLDDSVAEAYERELADMARRGKGLLHTEPLRMKPLDRDTVQISFVSATGPHGSTVTYAAGKPIREHLEIRFKSKFDHIEIEEGLIRVTPASPRFDSQSLLIPEQRVIAISPQRVRGLGAGDETEQIYSVDIDLGQVRLKNDLPSLWKAAWGKSGEEATLKLEFVIEVPQKNFHLRKQFIANYSASTVAEAKATGKVYAVDRLPSLMSEQITDVKVVSQVVFRVEYPWWPSVFWILLSVLALAIVFFGARMLLKIKPGGTKDWAVQATTERATPLDASIEQSSVMVQRERVGQIMGTRFTPVAGATLESGAPDIVLQAGIPVRVRLSDRRVILVFVDRSHQKVAADASAAPIQPRRR
jgi:hypothetical protein